MKVDGKMLYSVFAEVSDQSDWGAQSDENKAISEQAALLLCKKLSLCQMCGEQVDIQETNGQMLCLECHHVATGKVPTGETVYIWCSRMEPGPHLAWEQLPEDQRIMWNGVAENVATRISQQEDAGHDYRQ